jgi:hypothetical protein
MERWSLPHVQAQKFVEAEDVLETKVNFHHLRVSQQRFRAIEAARQGYAKLAHQEI